MESIDLCEICGSSEGVAHYQLDGEIVTRCEDHAVGISVAAEEIYWKLYESNQEET